MFGPNWSPSTLRQTVSAIERHLRPRWGQVQLRRVTPVDIDRFYAELRRRGGQGGKPLAGATVTRIHSILRASLEQGVRWGLVGHNPASRASPPRGGESEVRPPSPAELGRLLDAAAEDDLEFWTYLRLAASSGARRSQICGVRWSDLDLDVGMATFARAVVDGLDGLVVKDGKTHRAYVVALDSDTGVDDLERLQPLRPGHRPGRRRPPRLPPHEHRPPGSRAWWLIRPPARTGGRFGWSAGDHGERSG